MSTKEKILYEALKLFSINGYDATSIRDISKKLDLSASAIYRHYSSKKDILDKIIEECKEQFFSQLKNANIKDVRWNNLEKLCLSMFEFQTKNEMIVMFRRLLILEQYKNEEMAKLYKGFFIDLEVNNTAKIFSDLMDGGYLKKLNPYSLAIELYAPFFLYHLDLEKDEDVIERLKLHVKYFISNYSLDKEME